MFEPSKWSLKRILQTILGKGTLRGVFEFFFLYKRHKDPWGGPFNGQEKRKRIFQDIVTNCNIDAIIETGSFRGSTTAFFGNTGKPVYACESDSRYFIFSKLRLLTDKNIIIKKSDSRDFLRYLARIPSLASATCFFYLDAHWNDDLPLKEELAVIFSTWMNAVVMIDDFKVPEDTGYKFDDYGPGKRLDIGYLDSLGFNLIDFFPSSSYGETGQKRGCIVVTNSRKLGEGIARVKDLRSR